MNWMKQNWIKVGIVVLAFGSILFINKWHGSTLNAVIVSNTTTSPKEEEGLPIINISELPNALQDSFDEERYGFLYGGIVGDNGKYTKVLVEGVPIEKPVSISYSNERRPLNLKTDAEINELVIKRATENRFIGDELEMQRWQKQIDEQLSRYGKIARQYLPYDAITDYHTADIDGDGVKEKLITVCGISANHCSDYAEIIKGNEIVFSTQLYTNSRGIRPTLNGFYINWTNKDSFRNEDGEEAGACCELSHNRTEFVFQNWQFVPIKQLKIPHIWKKVVDSVDEVGQSPTKN